MLQVRGEVRCDSLHWEPRIGEEGVRGPDRLGASEAVVHQGEILVDWLHTMTPETGARDYS